MVGIHDSEVAEQLRQSARLRAVVDALNRDASQPRGLIRRTLSLGVRFVTLLLVVILAVDGWLAYNAFFGQPEAGATSSLTAEELSYSDLDIVDDSGAFAGHVAITNPFARDVSVWVTVDLYDADQHVGEVSGRVTLKPRSTSSLDLEGDDEFVNYTESRVHLSGWPV